MSAAAREHFHARIAPKFSDRPPTIFFVRARPLFMGSNASRNFAR
jgi:hypothetical protein